MIKTLNWCYSNLRKLAADPNCPHDYKTLLRSYRNYDYKFQMIWKAAALDPRFTLVEIRGALFRLSPKHLEFWKAGQFEKLCPRWIAYAKSKIEQFSNSENRHPLKSPRDLPVEEPARISKRRKSTRSFNTLGKSYKNLRELANDINCPYSYTVLLKKYQEYAGNFNKIWWDSFKTLSWPKTKIRDGWRFRLSHKHRFIATELESLAPRWFKLWVTKWHDLRDFEDPKYQ